MALDKPAHPSVLNAVKVYSPEAVTSSMLPALVPSLQSYEEKPVGAINRADSPGQSSVAEAVISNGTVQGTSSTVWYWSTAGVVNSVVKPLGQNTVAVSTTSLAPSPKWQENVDVMP